MSGNYVVDEINAIIDGSDELQHYGMPRRSGRYPYGSGEDPYQHGRDLIGRIEELKKNGWTETPENIRKEFGITTTQYRAQVGLAKAERKSYDIARARSLAKDCIGPSEIARIMSTEGRTINESTVRGWLENDKTETRAKQARATANTIKKAVDEKGMIDIGKGVENELGIKREKLNQAITLLEMEGYHKLGARVPQVTNKGQMTTIQVIAPPETPYKINADGKKVSSEVYKLDQIHSMNDYHSSDDGDTFDKLSYPKSLDSSRVKIRYAEEGGADKDGAVEIRRGVDDISLGDDHFSQVRILVDGTHYIKGMAVYSDDMPDGVDVVFNTNKTSSTPKMDVLKKIKDDPDNPFGALIKAGGQSYYTDKNGERQLSVINKTRGEGDWEEWADALPAQFLSKQSKYMAKKQLNLAVVDKMAEFDEICSLTNPTVKKFFLDKFAEDCDSAAVHLKAAALPGQKYHVLLPVPSMSDKEVYAPRYDNGTKLALIRYPHGGIFEIPILTVNNKIEAARKLVGSQGRDAVCVNSANAARLSGADFDGDTVMCIPTHDAGGKVKIASRKQLEGLKDFDPKAAYGPDTYEPGSIKLLSEENKQREMGVVSNLINDMTLAGASDDKMAAAVRHSMVIIDATKHKLDWKRSEKDNNISALKKEFQRTVLEDGSIKVGGASTLISRSKSQYSVVKRQGSPKINIKGKPWYDPTKPEGANIYKVADDAYYPNKKFNRKTGLTTAVTTTGKKLVYDEKDPEQKEKYSPIKVIDSDGTVRFTNKAGDIEYAVKSRKQQSTKMAETDDAYTLMSDMQHPMERLYADYANKMKSLANQARKELATTGKIEYKKTAKSVYQEEVAELDRKLNIALLNKPRERMANIKAAIEVDAKIQSIMDANPGMTRKEAAKELGEKKASQVALTKYRRELGATSRSQRNIPITDKEWEAIQAGAISENKLKQILDNTDADALRARAMPKATTTLSTAKINQIKALSASNYTIAEISKKMGVSTSTITNYLKGGKQ